MEKMREILRYRCRLLRQSESGQSLVEFAVLGSLFVVILLGAVEFGLIAYDSIEVSNAALAGAQYGELNSVNASDTTGIANAAIAAAPDVSSLHVTSSRSCICSDGTASTCSVGDCSTSHIEAQVTVNTSATITPSMYLPGFTSFTLTGQAIQKCLQTEGL